MTSTVEDIDVDRMDHMDHIPDFSSILEHGITTHDSCRIEKDSSNDEDMFGDSSQEGSQAALDIFPFDPLSVALPLDECPAEEAPTILPTIETDTVPLQDTIGTQETACSMLTADEDCIRKINEEETKFYENYVSSNSGDISSLRCTVCSDQLFVVTPANIKFHPILGVLICKGCRDYYNSGEFSKDDSGYDEYCRWCAEGGSLICCDTCTNVFCKSCLRRCLGRAVLWNMENGGGSWSCLVCNQQPLWPFRALSRLVLTAVEKKKRNQGRRTGQSLKGSTSAVGDVAAAGDVSEAADAAAWLSSCVIEAEKLTTRCKSLARKAGEILAKGTGHSNHPIDKMDEAGISAAQDSDKIRVVQCCRQLRKAVSATNFALKMLDKKIVRNYKRTYGSTSEIEDADSVSGAGNSAQSGDGDPSSKRLVLKIKNFRDAGTKKQGRHDYYAEIRGSPQVSSKDKTKVSRNSDSVTTVKAEPQVERSQPEGEDGDDSDQFFDTCSTGNPLTDDQSNDATPRPKTGPSIKTENLQSSRAMDDSCGNDWEQFDPLSGLRADSLPSGGADKVKTEPEPEEVKEATSLNGSNVPSSSRNGRKSRREPSSSSSPSKSDISKSMDPSEKARRALLAESSSGDDSDVSLSDFSHFDSPNTKKSKERKCKREFLAKTPDIDMKLNSECAVVVRRIVDVNQQGKSENGADSDEMDKPKIKPKVEKGSSDEEQEQSAASTGQPSDKSKSQKSRKERKTFRLSDLSSTSDSESDDWDLSGDTPSVAHSTQESATGATETARVSTPIDPNEAVRHELLASSSSDDSGASNDDEPIAQRKSLKSKVAESPALVENDAVGIEEDAGPNGIKCELLEEDDGEESEGKDEVKKSSKLLRIPKLVDSDDDDDDSTAKAKLEPEVDIKKEEGEGKKKPKRTKDSKKKRRIHSDSDFESSEGDSEENKKKRKRKSKKAAEEEGADEDDEDDDDEDSEEESKPKRRRRIKKQADSSDSGSDSDVQILNESENGGKIGRKNIKKILKNKNLEDKTKSAAREEDERRRRIAERQKRYNDVFTNDNALANAQTHHLVLDFDDKTKKELVTVHKNLVNKLKPHQVKGVKFMWDACFESVERIKTHKGSGCILAHCMGLGKSLQVVTLVHTVLSHPECQVSRVIVVCPLSTVLNWVNEFQIWLNKEDMELEVYEMSSLKTNDLRMYTLRNWHETGGVMILGYDMFRNLTNDKKKGIKPKMREIFQKTLVDPGPDLVICDEGHLLKNEATATSKAMNRVRTLRRVVLTGTPLQNNLVEYHCMVQFVKPNLLGTKREFTNRFVNPIKNGQCADSTDQDVRLMKRRAHVLHKMLEGSVQRFDYSVLTPFLPPKHEYVISVKMSDLQIQMYQHYLDRCARGGPKSTTSAGRNKSSGLFADFQELGRVWTHPKALHLSQLRRDLKAITEGNEDSEGSLADFIDDGSGSESDDGGVVCLGDSGDDKDDDEGGDEVKVNGWRSRTRAGRGNQPPPEEELGVTAPLSSTWWSQFVNDDDMTKLEHSGKLVLLMDILRQCELIGDKVLVFSQSLVSLDLIEEFLLAENDRMAQNRINQSENQEDASVGTWTLNADYFRLDGSTSAELRKTWTNHFNNPKNLRSRLFLISTRAGGLGINLVAANRVIIFDASWNPSHDVQSIFRIYRFGQKKPCYVYRFLAQGTMEEKIYDRQVTKLSLSCRVVDEQQIERHFNSADLNELYRFEADSHTRRPTPPLPKDRLLAELMIQRKEWIVTFHEHDSLLENKEDEELNEDERKAAWDDFENEKRGMVHTVPNVYAGVSGDMAGMSGMMGLGAIGAMGNVIEMITGRSVAGIPLTNIAAMIMNSNPGITQDEFLGRLRLTVEQLQNFSVQQAAAGGSAMNSGGSQQPGDAQRLLLQRQVAADQLKRQFGPPAGSTGNPGPSGVAPIIQPRSRGRPPIGPHQRTDLYGLAPVIYSSAASGTGTAPPAMPGRSNSSTQPGPKAPPKT